MISSLNMVVKSNPPQIFMDLYDYEIPSINVNTPCILALDPSTTQTGIVIGSESGKIAIVADFINNCSNKQDYLQELAECLNILTSRVNIVKMVLEVPFKPNVKDNASVALKMVEKYLKSLQPIFPNLKKSEVYPMLPNIWRHSFLANERHKGKRKDRDLLKEAAQLEACIRFPEFKSYWTKFNTPQDSCDAVGVYCGFIHEHWYSYKQGLKRISKVNSRLRQNYNYKIKPLVGSVSEIIADATREIPNFSKDDIYIYNSYYSKDVNYMVGSAVDKKVSLLLAIKQEDIQLLRWEIPDIEVLPSDKIAFIVSRGA